MCHIMSQLLDYVKAITDSHTNSDNKENIANNHQETDSEVADLPKNAISLSHCRTVDSRIKSTDVLSPSEVLNGAYSEEINNAGEAENISGGQIRCVFYDYCKLSFITHMSRDVRKQTFWFPTLSDTNKAVQPQKMARGLKFQI